MFWRLEKHAKTTAKTRMQLKIALLLIYDVLIDNTLKRAAMFSFFCHPYLERTAVLSDIHCRIQIDILGNVPLTNFLTFQNIA